MVNRNSTAVNNVKAAQLAKTNNGIQRGPRISIALDERLGFIKCINKAAVPKIKKTNESIDAIHDHAEEW